jgi:hypothetical protein
VDHLAAHGKEPAIVIEGDLEVPVLLAFLYGSEKMLAPAPAAGLSRQA